MVEKSCHRRYPVSTQVKFVTLFLGLLSCQENLVRTLSANTMKSVTKLQTGTLNAGALGVTLRTPPRGRPSCAGTTTNRTLTCASLDWNLVSFRHGYRKNTMGFVVSKHGIDESLVKTTVVRTCRYSKWGCTS